MSDERQGQRQSVCPHPEAVGTRWGDPISEERQRELQGFLDWRAQEQDHGARKGVPFVQGRRGEWVVGLQPSATLAAFVPPPTAITPPSSTSAPHQMALPDDAPQLPPG